MLEELIAVVEFDSEAVASRGAQAGPSCSAKDLIGKLLTTKAEERLTASQALEHEWIADTKKTQKSTLTLTRKNLMKHHGTRLKVRALSNSF